jgi:hypothetical protein
MRSSNKQRKRGQLLGILLAYAWILAFFAVRCIAGLRGKKLFPAEG